MIGIIALTCGLPGSYGCGVRDLEVFAPRNSRDEPNHVPPPIPKFDGGKIVIVLGEPADAGIGLDEDPPRRPIRADARMVPTSEGIEDDEDASTVLVLPPEDLCPVGDYTGTISCTFPATGTRLAGSVALSVEPASPDHAPQHVTGTLMLVPLQGDPVDIAGAFAGTVDCDKGTLKVTTAEPLGGQVPGFLSATVPITLEAMYDEEMNDFTGDVNLPGGSGCAGTWSALENLLD